MAKKKLAKLKANPKFAASLKSAWGKILEYLHEDGKTQMAVAKRMVRVWRLALQLAEAAEEGARKSVTVEMSLWSKMGMNLGHDTLKVANTTPGGQAEEKGVMAGWVCRRVEDRPVATLTEFMAAINDCRDRGVADVPVVFELDALSSAKFRAAEKAKQQQSGARRGRG